MDPFIGQIIMFGGNFAPRGWAFCDGQLLSISSNSALFSILGTTYGGDGRTTFGLPGLRGRVPIHPGNGPGLSSYSLGQKGGVEHVTLNANQMPAHNHLLSAADIGGDDSAPSTGHAFGNSSNDLFIEAAQGGSMGSSTIKNAGSGQGHTNIQPYGCVNFIIALVGTFPSRN